MCQLSCLRPLVILFLYCFVLHAFGAINIIDLQVPQSVDGSSDNPLILDCIYNAENESGLEVKWFFNDDQQISFWIPGLTKMQGIGKFATLLDTEYKASKEPNSIYRALYIKETSLDMTGNYTCKVSSDFHEDVQTKEMVVYESAKDFEVVHERESNTVICSAKGLYPKPLMVLSAKYIGDSNETVPIYEPSESIPMTENGTFDSAYTIEYENLEGPVDFICNISIPETDYYKVTTLRYYPVVTNIEKNETDFGLPCSLPSTWLVFSSLLIVGGWNC